MIENLMSENKNEEKTKQLFVINATDGNYVVDLQNIIEIYTTNEKLCIRYKLTEFAVSDNVYINNIKHAHELCQRLNVLHKTDKYSELITYDKYIDVCLHILQNLNYNKFEISMSYKDKKIAETCPIDKLLSERQFYSSPKIIPNMLNKLTEKIESELESNEIISDIKFDILEDAMRKAPEVYIEDFIKIGVLKICNGVNNNG